MPQPNPKVDKVSMFSDREKRIIKRKKSKRMKNERDR